MIYFDLSKDLVLIDEKVADLRTLTYVTDATILKEMQDNFKIVIEKAKLNESEIGLTSQTLGTLASYGTDLLEFGVPKVLKYLKGFLPDTIEGWIHLGVDTVSLILDILGPFTAGIGSGASAVIDIIHGIYYIGASQNWTGFPDRREKEFEYLLCGFITLGFAAIPMGGNVGSIGFKTFLKKNPITKDITVWLEKLFASSVGKFVEKIFKWIFEKAGSLGRFFYKMFENMTKIPIVGGIFKLFGNLLKDGIGKISSGIDKLLTKFFSKPGVAKYFEKKFGKEFTEKQATILGAKSAEQAIKKGEIDSAKKIAEETGDKLAKKAINKAGKDLLKTLPVYKSITSKLKMIVSQIVADKVSITEGLNLCYQLLIGKLENKDTEFNKLKEVGLPVDEYKEWYLEYAFFLDDDARDDEDLSTEDIKKIQEYLIEYSDAFESKKKPEVTGKIDAQTVYATRQLFEYLKDQDISEMSGDELDSAKELIKHCEDGLTELNKLDKSLFTSLKDKLTQTSESYLFKFETFDK